MYADNFEIVATGPFRLNNMYIEPGFQSKLPRVRGISEAFLWLHTGGWALSWRIRDVLNQPCVQGVCAPHTSNPLQTRRSRSALAHTHSRRNPLPDKEAFPNPNPRDIALLFVSSYFNITAYPPFFFLSFIIYSSKNSST